MTGKFIVLEGLEGAGKTTAHKAVVEALQAQGIQDLVFTREPGGTPLAEKLRQLIKHEIDEPVTDKAELLMLYAARIQLVENVIKPALAQEKWVIGDRHDLSTQAYQGGGRQLDRQLLVCLKQRILGDFSPDLTLYLDINPELGLSRARSRGALDRIEKQQLDFFQRTREVYLEEAVNNPKVIKIDASQSIEQVANVVKRVIKNWVISQENE